MKTYKYNGYQYTIMQKHNGTYDIIIDNEQGEMVWDDDDFRSLSSAIECSKHKIDELIFNQ